MSVRIPLLEYQKRYHRGEERFRKKFIQFLADMGEAKVPFKLLRNDYKLVILEEAKRGIDKEIEEVFGREKAEEFRKWLEEKYMSLPQILGEDFSYNILVLLFNLFVRYLYERYLKEEKQGKRSNFLKRMRELGIIHVILREGLWYKRVPPFAQRALSFYTNPRDSRTDSPRLLMLFLKVLLDSDFVCGKEEDIGKMRNYIDKWLELSYEKKPYIERYQEIEKFFRDVLTKDFKRWFEKNFKVTVAQGECLWLKMKRQDTLLNARTSRTNWVTDEVAEKLGLRMSEDKLFPTIREKHKKEIKKWEREFRKRKYI